MRSFTEKRSEPRTVVDEYYSVQFFISKLDSVYHFILWDISPHGLCILVEQDSSVMEFLTTGAVFNMKFFPHNMRDETRIVRTRVCHVTVGESARFRGYYMVGLEILE